LELVHENHFSLRNLLTINTPAYLVAASLTEKENMALAANFLQGQKDLGGANTPGYCLYKY